MDESGLGGRNTLRGFKRGRFIGKAATLVDGEERWSVSDGNVMQLKLNFHWSSMNRSVSFTSLEVLHLSDGTLSQDNPDWQRETRANQ